MRFKVKETASWIVWSSCTSSCLTPHRSVLTPHLAGSFIEKLANGKSRSNSQVPCDREGWGSLCACLEGVRLSTVFWRLVVWQHAPEMIERCETRLELCNAVFKLMQFPRTSATLELLLVEKYVLHIIYNSCQLLLINVFWTWKLMALAP